MKCRRQFLPVVLMGLLLLSGCGKVNGNVPVIADSSSSEESLSDVALSESLEPAETKDESIESQDEIKTTNKIAGVSIDFDYTRMSGKASNQIALWIENESGEIVKTIFATDFTASRRGYENREDALRHWVASANPGELTDTEIDAISSATPQTGAQHFVWDLTDDNGQRVSDGRYYIMLEGTLYWSSNVLYTGMVDLNDTAPGELEITAERSEPDNTDNETMIQNVRMSAMAENKNTVDNTANWLGGLEPERRLNI